MPKPSWGAGGDAPSGKSRRASQAARPTHNSAATTTQARIDRHPAASAVAMRSPARPSPYGLAFAVIAS